MLVSLIAFLAGSHELTRDLPVGWIPDYSAALAYARKRNQPLMVVLLSNGMGMGSWRLIETLRSGKVAEAVRDFIPVMVADGRACQIIAAKFGAGPASGILWLSPEGEFAYRTAGMMWPEEFLAASEKARAMLRSWDSVVARDRAGSATSDDRTVLADGFAARGDLATALLQTKLAESEGATSAKLYNAYQALGDLYRSRRQFEDATGCYKRASELAGSDDERFRAKFRLGASWFRAGNATRARTVFTALRATPGLDEDRKGMLDRFLNMGPGFGTR